MKPGKSFQHRSGLFGLILLLAAVIMSPVISFSQPSGGPYGPVRQSYNLPQMQGHIIFVSPDGDEKAAGNSIVSPTSIEAAISRVSTGDAIILRGGTYRTGDLILNQGITMQPYMDEPPVLKGTFVADQWRN